MLIRIKKVGIKMYLFWFYIINLKPTKIVYLILKIIKNNYLKKAFKIHYYYNCILITLLFMMS